MIPKEFVYYKIGMALISAQRVEYLTRELVKHLIEFDSEIYGIADQSFFDHSPSAQKLRKQTLGHIFKLLKLNPKLVLADELDNYLGKRNTLAHGFWKEFLSKASEEQEEKAVRFCNEFGRMSERMESFFKGFLFFLALRHIKDRYEIKGSLGEWGNDFDYFMIALNQKKLPIAIAEENSNFSQ